MGMAASQARLLTITARIHDVEYQAQSIQNAKMQLARLSDAAMQEYLAILDGQQMTVSTMGNGYTVQNIVATFNNLVGSNHLVGSSGQQYAVRNENGALVVPDDIYKAYAKHGGKEYCNSPEEFAATMLAGGASATDEEIDDYMDSGKVQQSELYQYYCSMYQLIQYAKGKCVSIADYDGFGNGDAANNSEFLDGKIRSGGWTIEIITNNEKTGEIKLAGTSVNSDTALASTPTKEIDQKELAKAEAKYEHTLKQIDAKDKRYDMELSKLETERNALTTQYDSVKKVIEDNVERTFGIFS